MLRIHLWLYNVCESCIQFVIVVFPDHTHLLFFTGTQHSCTVDTSD